MTPDVPLPSDPKVRAAFLAAPPVCRRHLLRLRGLIFETAADLDGVGPVEEALRWGEPAYLTATGTTIRLGWHDAHTVALYVHCQTDLIANIRARHGAALVYEGTRGLHFDIGVALPIEAVRDGIALALTYRLRKRAERRARSRTGG